MRQLNLKGFFGFNLILFVGWLLAACASVFPETGFDPSVSDGGQGGDSEPVPDGVLQLPFSAGEIHRCTQGANDNYSHDMASTQYGLDLDTSNSADEEIYAPASGTAYVFYDESDTGFGYHINIDRGDGTYVVLGHMTEIIVDDDSEVAAGQLLGYEGCTGNCSGDHVHLDLHQGDARLMAQDGVSVAAEYYTADTTVGSEAEYLSSVDFVCDLYSGHYYESQLSVTTWHPDGTLLFYPATSEVFVTDQGQLHWFENEEVFWSYGYDFADLTTMSERELWCWEETGASLSETTEYRAVADEDGIVWLAYEKADDPNRYRQVVPEEITDEILSSWGILNTASYEDADGADMLADYSAKAGTARLRDGTLVQEAGSNAIYVVNEGYAIPISDWTTYLMLGFGPRNIVVLSAGTLVLGVLEIGSCEVGTSCINQDIITSCRGDLWPDPGDDDDDDDDDDDNDASDDDDDDVSDDDSESDDDSVGDDDSEADDDASDDDNDSETDDDTLDDDSESDDDDTVADDDDTSDDDSESDDDSVGDDDSEVDDDVSDDDDTFNPNPDWMLLEIDALLLGAPADCLELAGELLDQYDSPAGGGFWWATLETVQQGNYVSWSAYVLSGWSFRYSVEYQRYGVTSWSCVAPYPPGTVTMTVSAELDGAAVTIQTIDNHLGGCELYVEVP